MTTPRPRPWRTRRRLLLTGTVTAVIGLAAIAQIFIARAASSWEEVVATFVPLAVLTVVGALILDRRPGHPIGRLCLLIGVLMAAAPELQATAMLFDRIRPRNELIVGLAAQGALIAQVFAFVGGPLLLVRFPDGLSTGRLCRLVDLLILIVTVGVVVHATGTKDLDPDWISPTRSPIGIGLPSEVLDAIRMGALLLLLIAYAAAAATLIGRYRTGDRMVRAQVRWVAAAAALTAGAFIFVAATAIFQIDANWVWSAWLLSTAVPPVAIGLAIMRYRLYDIDRIISRTIGYLVVTGILAALFVGANLVVQAAANALTGASGIAVAVSTLLVAAAFSPIRRRVQVVVDRRFHRAGYDAERTVEGLRRRLRDEVEPEAIRAALSEAIARSVQPSAAGVWLRAQGDATR